MYESNNPAVVKSVDLAVKIVKLYQFLNDKKKEFVMSKQVLRSGTSVGANIKESLYAQSEADFYTKISIALKEASETEYWLELLKTTGYLDNEQFSYVNSVCSEVIKILIKSTQTMKLKQSQTK
ncbi:MAG: four helix bundle protein [Acidaminococcaceae bacterium]|nr:four helix bundle protein [Acidaminococcaceae bacterium]